MKTPELNKALKNAPEWANFKVTMNADGGSLAHTDIKSAPSEVRGMMKRLTSLARARMVVTCVDLCGGGNRPVVIFDGIPVK